MKTPRYFISLLLLAFIITQTITSCNKRTNDSSPLVKYGTRFVPNEFDGKTFILDSLTSSASCYLSYYEDKSGKSLYLLNLLNNSLEQYDWNGGNLIRKIKMEKEGPNGVGNATGFFVKSRDSIIVLSGYRHKASLVDSIGRLIRMYSLFINENQNKELLGEGVISYGDEANNMAIFNNRFLANASPFNDPAVESYYSTGRYGLDLDLESGKVATIMSPPAHFRRKFADGHRFTSQQNFYGQDYNLEKGTCVVSFMTEDSIYEVDLKSKKVSSHLAKSDRIDEIKWMKRSMDISNPANELEFFIENQFYPSISYDKYRDIYVRFAAHKNLNKKEKMDSSPLVVFSLIVLNKDFKKLCEELLDEKYNSNTLISTKDAIYLKRRSEDENKLVLVPFNLQGNKGQ